MHPIVKILDQRTLRVVGLMSGTSLDGIDAALVEIDRDPFAVRLLAFVSRPYTDAERRRISGLFSGDAASLCQGNFWLGQCFAAAALRVLEHAQLDLRKLDLVGSHGQTVWHQPPSRSAAGTVASTLQLGEPAVIAATLGCLTVADFRVADLALGGEGAPLVPFVDALLYAKPDRRRALQNIGGIANVTFLVPGHAPIAFDSGPGNMVIDALAEQLSAGAERFDRDGMLSQQGRVVPALLTEMLRLDEPYLRQPPPKSTGREHYGAGYTERFMSRAADQGISPYDVLRTAVAFTAQTISDALRFCPEPIDEMLLSGGGVHNQTLLYELRSRLPNLTIASLAEEGLDPDAKEAVAFAILAAHAVWAKPSNVPTVTGARHPAVLGKICLP